MSRQIPDFPANRLQSRLTTGRDIIANDFRNSPLWGERLSGLSSCESILGSRVTCFGIESNEEFSGECDTHDHFLFASGGESSMKVCEAGVVSAGDVGDQEQDRSDTGAATADVPVAGPGAAIVGERRQAGELDDGFVGVDADLGQFGQRSRHGTVGPP